MNECKGFLLGAWHVVTVQYILAKTLKNPVTHTIHEAAGSMCALRGGGEWN